MKNNSGYILGVSLFIIGLFLLYGCSSIQVGGPMESKPKQFRSYSTESGKRTPTEFKQVEIEDADKANQRDGDFKINPEIYNEEVKNASPARAGRYKNPNKPLF